MLTYQFVAGFSEIKSHLRKQIKLSKSLSELRLWFSVDDGVLIVHDFHDHEKCLPLAIYYEPEAYWWVFFSGQSFW